MASSVESLVPPATPSPTLTNPDMILPDLDYSHSSTPSPPQQHLPLSPAGALKSRQSPSEDPRQHISPGDFSIRATTPQLLYGSGTALSDIAEVDTPIVSRSNTTSRVEKMSKSPPLASSPTLADPKSQFLSPNGKLDIRRISYASSGGLSDLDAHLDGLDDTASIASGSIFMEDTESNAGDDPRTIERSGTFDDPYSSAALSRRAEQILANAKRRLDTMEGNLTRARHSLIVTPSPSISSLSSKSVYSPKIPLDAIEERQTLSSSTITPGKQRFLHSNNSNGSLGHSRVVSETSIPTIQNTSFNYEKDPAEKRAASVLGSRGESARNANSSDTSGSQTLRGSKSVGYINGSQPASYTLTTYLNGPATSPGPYSAPLFPSHERDLSASQTISVRRTDRNSASTELSQGSYRHSLSSSSNGISRSNSTAQVRDLRDQMNDLKGKIADMKQRAREEGLRRRSLQSLRTPSPFTAAEMWCNSAPGQKESRLSGDDAGSTYVEKVRPAGEAELLQVSQPIETSKSDGSGDESPIIPDNESVAPSQYEDAGEYLPEEGNEVVQNALAKSEIPYEDRSVYDENGELITDEFADESIDGHYNTLDEGYQEEVDGPEEQVEQYEEDYEDDTLIQKDFSENEERLVEEDEEDDDDGSLSASGERHEDRADAFDYEHFFLHSGMGNYSRQSFHSDSSSSSQDSVETARGFEPQDSSTNDPSIYLQPPKHQRQNSGDSISTIATFQTATEGRDSDGEDDDEISLASSRPISAHLNTHMQQVFTHGNVKQVDIQRYDDAPDQVEEQEVHEESVERNGSTTPTLVNYEIEPILESPVSIVKVNGINGINHPPMIRRSSIEGSITSVRSFPLLHRPKSSSSSVQAGSSLYASSISTNNRSLSSLHASNNSSILVSTLMRGSTSPAASGTSTPMLQLSKDDKDLVEGMVEALGKVVVHLHDPTSEGEVKRFRRRLELARKALDGEWDD